jgi:hypothetical protein
MRIGVNGFGGELVKRRFGEDEYFNGIVLIEREDEGR